MWASRETILVHLAQSYRPIPSHFLQCPAELVRRDRLIRPRHLVWLHSLSRFLGLTITFAGTYSTSPENHTKFMSQALLYPTRSLLISLLDLPIKRSDLCPFLPPILFNVAHLCPLYVTFLMMGTRSLPTAGRTHCTTHSVPYSSLSQLW
jgi:hypothetical protein